MTKMTKTMQVARYANTNHIGIAIIAIVTCLADNVLFDWSAYIGASPYTQHEESATTATRRWGNKPSTEDAHHYFPHLPTARYRT